MADVRGHQYPKSLEENRRISDIHLCIARNITANTMYIILQYPLNYQQ